MITHPHVVAAVAGAVVGLVEGSFAGVVADRVPRGESIVRPPSHCTACKAPLRPLDNIPVVSYLVLRGKCRSCGVKIPPRDFYIELVTAAAFAAVAARVPTFWDLPAYFALVTGLVALSAIDFEHKRLPNPVLYTTAAVVAPLLVLAAWRGHRWGFWLTALIGAAACFAAFYALFFFAPKAMGFGDVRLSALCGGALGFIGGPTVFVGMFLAFLSATIPSLYLMGTGKAGMKTRIPFGPFIAFGTVVGICIGPLITHIWLPSSGG